MGTPPAPMYATLYFSIHEELVVPKFQDNIIFYGCYIDNVIVIWKNTAAIQLCQNFHCFQLEMNQFGKI